ncbi:hypothetical protein D3C71_1224270 [compost metagenome]
MVDGAIARAGHHQPLDPISHQCVHHGSRCASVADDHFHARPGCGIHYIFNSIQCWNTRRQGPILHKADSPLLHPTQRPGLARVERIHPVGVHLLNLPCPMNFASGDRQHTPCAGRDRHSNSIQKILRPIGRERRGRAHGTGQHHGFRAGVQHFVQKPRRLFQRVGSVGNDYTTHLGIFQVVRTAQRQRLPHLAIHVLAVDLGHLLRHQHAPRGLLQSGNSCKQLPDPYLRSGVADVVASLRGRARNGPSGTQNHNFLPTHLRTPKNW